MKALDRFLKFQRSQGGILTAADAAEICNVPRSRIHDWAVQRRIAYVMRNGRRYFGLESVRQFASISNYLKSFRDPDAPPGENEAGDAGL